MKVRAGYDSAQTTPHNERHWSLTDGLSARAAASPAVRRIIRNRARYECDNNSYASGMIQTLANYVIGTGPRLQVRSASDENNSSAEALFSAWAKEIRLPQKLRTMRQAKARDGEAFAIFVLNERLRSPIKLDIRLIEAEQVTTPNLILPTTQEVDGIVFDAAGNPTTYHVLKHHPGDTTFAALQEYDSVDASNVIHWFRADRPGQARGISEIQPSLHLFAQLRRYTLSVLSAAETAANLSALIHSDAPPDADDIDQAEPFDTFEIERNTAMTLPMGWKATQLKAEQPTSTYSDFKRQIVSEAGRVVNMPYNITAGDSSNYNYSSGRLDHQTFFSSVDIERVECEDVVLDRVFHRFMSEATLIEGVLPQELRTLADIPHKWHWDQPVAIDQNKDATAKQTRLISKQATLADICAEEGRDWRDHVRQLAAEVDFCEANGVTHPSATPAPAPSQPTQPEPNQQDEEETANESV